MMNEDGMKSSPSSINHFKVLCGLVHRSTRDSGIDGFDQPIQNVVWPVAAAADVQGLV